MMPKEADHYVAEVRDKVFFATIRAIADLKHSRSIADQKGTMSFYATIDALLKVLAELIAESGLASNPMIEAAMYSDFQVILARHLADARRSVAERGESGRKVGSFI